MCQSAALRPGEGPSQHDGLSYGGAPGEGTPLLHAPDPQDPPLFGTGLSDVLEESPSHDTLLDSWNFPLGDDTVSPRSHQVPLETDSNSTVRYIIWHLTFLHSHILPPDTISCRKPKCFPQRPNCSRMHTRLANLSAL